MARVNVKSKESNRMIGQAIIQAWDEAIRRDKENPVLDRAKLLETIKDFIDLEDFRYNKKKIEIDLVFDTDLDENTRLVWISIPTPDVGAGGRFNTWQDWKNDYYDRHSGDVQAQKEEELGQAVLFGCGR